MVPAWYKCTMRYQTPGEEEKYQEQNMPDATKGSAVLASLSFSLVHGEIGFQTHLLHSTRAANFSLVAYYVM